MLKREFDEIKQMLKRVLSIHNNIPKWYPLTLDYANECGYKTVDGLRKWCYANLPPDDFIKKGRFWYVNVRSLHLLSKKVS